MTIQLHFSKEEQDALHYERFHHPHPRVQLKMETLWLKSQKVAHKDISRLTGVCPNTMREYFRQYEEGGVARLKELRFVKPQSLLMEHRSFIEEDFRKKPPRSSIEAAARIEELTGIRRSPCRIRSFLKNIGLKYRKVGMIPAKADTEKQDEFVKKNLALDL